MEHLALARRRSRIRHEARLSSGAVSTSKWSLIRVVVAYRPQHGSSGPEHRRAAAPPPATNRELCCRTRVAQVLRPLLGMRAIDGALGPFAPPLPHPPRPQGVGTRSGAGATGRAVARRN